MKRRLKDIGLMREEVKCKARGTEGWDSGRNEYHVYAYNVTPLTVVWTSFKKNGQSLNKS